MVVTQPAPVAPAPYEHTGQGHDRRRRQRRGPGRRTRLWRLEITAGAVAMVAVTVALTAWPAAAPARAMPPGVRLVRSGLVMADPFDRPVPDRQLMDSYVFNGSARPGIGWVQGTAKGLDVGVRPHPGWQGWFAVTLHSAGAGTVWHAVMSRPARTLPRAAGEAVLAVQSASTQHNGSIDYVVVSTLSRHGENTWQVGSAHGVVADASTQFLWQEPLRADTPPTEPVTIRTDGRHRLEVWLGDREVFGSDHLDMHDPPPFQAYLEVQALDTGYVSAFTDYWVADDAPVTVQGVAPGARVELRTGHHVITATAGDSGDAVLHVPPPLLVGTGTLVVRDGAAVHRLPGLRYAGGDVLRLAAG